jgi:predicted metal-dependent hydrolase
MKVVYHPRAKHLKLKVLSDGSIEVVAPKRATKRDIELFVLHSQEWIQKVQKKHSEHHKKLSDELEGYKGKILVGGEWIEGVIQPLQKRLFDQKGGIITFKSPKGIEAFYRQKSLDDALGLVQEMAPMMGVEVAKVQVKFVKTRWGSCSSRGVITINAHLAKAPPFVMSYVVVHELAHRVHMNHSKPFWELVAQYNQDHLKAREWLDEFHSIVTTDLSKNLSIIT